MLAPNLSIFTAVRNAPLGMMLVIFFRMPLQLLFGILLIDIFIILVALIVLKAYVASLPAILNLKA
ncbi:MULTISPECIES: hypothetical protein [unclassified Deinococcus]|uniref:hypothetical protein n=1 Tax=unclassified Deinococcus TaxID=2623546 RepID=UPI001C2F8E9C|nr:MULTISPECIES: hypothetical protein [unclassified Deinococcus]MDK2013288.1 hypothetical protein [Deinococcus sp. 43]